MSIGKLAIVILILMILLSIPAYAKKEGITKEKAPAQRSVVISNDVSSPSEKNQQLPLAALDHGKVLNKSKAKPVKEPSIRAKEGFVYKTPIEQVSFSGRNGKKKMMGTDDENIPPPSIHEPEKIDNKKDSSKTKEPGLIEEKVFVSNQARSAYIPKKRLVEKDSEDRLPEVDKKKSNPGSNLEKTPGYIAPETKDLNIQSSEEDHEQERSEKKVSKQIIPDHTPDTSNELSTTEETGNPLSPDNPVSLVFLSGLTALTGVGTALSVSPTMVFPETVGAIKTVSFIPRTVQALKVVLGEFLEDWVITLRTRLPVLSIARFSSIPVDRRLKRFFVDLETVKYTFLKTETTLLELFKIFFSVAVLSTGFSLVQSLSLGSLFHILPLAFIAVGSAVLAHNYAHEFIAREYGVDTRFDIWPLGIVIMFASLFFGGFFAAFMNNEIKGKTRDHGPIYLAGPLINILLALIYLQIATYSGVLGLLGGIGAAVNISIATYNLLPMKPVDGYYIYKWNKFWWIIMIVPSIVIAAEALEGVVL